MKTVYLDNSATTYPKPESVKQAVARSISFYGANPGRSAYAMAEASAMAVYKVRQKAAAFFGAQGPEQVVFTKNCTEALNLVLMGTLKPGDHLVVSDLEHNAVMRPAKILEERGIGVSVFKTDPMNPGACLDSLRESLRENTKLVVCTAASNVFGFRLPIARLGAMCHIYDIAFCVDAAQAAGVVPINMLEDSIDYLCVPSHKGLYGLMGAGMLLCKNSPEPMQFGGTGTNSLSPYQPDELPERLESGTINVPGIIGIGAGLDFVSHMGIEKIHRGEMEKLQYIYKKLSAIPNIQLYTAFPTSEHFVPVLSFTVRNMDSEVVGEQLAISGIAVRCGLHCAPSAHRKMGTLAGTVRVSPSVFTTRDGMDYFINQLYRIVKK